MHALPEFQTLEDKVTAAADRESDEYFTEISFTFSTKHIAASPDPTDRGSLAVCPLDQHVGLSQEGDRAQQSKIVVTEAAIRQNGSLLRYERSSKRSNVEAHTKGKWGKNRGLHDGAVMEPAYKVKQVMLRNTSPQ